MKKLTAVLLSIIMLLSPVSGVSAATGEETISVTLRFDASVVADDMDTLYSDLRAAYIIDEEITNLPSEITVTVQKGATVKEVIEAAAEEEAFTIVGLDENYVTQVGYVGSEILENLVSTSVGNYYSGNIFASAGWSFYIDGEGLMSGIDAVTVEKDGAVLEGRFGLAVGWDSNWNAIHYDELFLENYALLGELTETEVDTSSFSESEIEKLRAEKAEAEALLTEIYNEASLNNEVSSLLLELHPEFKTSGGMWIGYMEKKGVSFWGTGSPSEKLELAVKELSAAMAPLPSNLLSELYVTTLFGTAEDNLITDFSSDKTSYAVANFTKDNFLPKFMKLKAVATSEDATVSILLNGETVSLSELSDGWKQYSNLDWESGNCNTLTFTVTPPEGSTLSETVYTVKIFSEEAETVIPPMSKEERDEKIAELLGNIAGAYTEKSSYWEVMDMGAYKKLVPETEDVLTASAERAFINMSIKDVAEKAGDTDLAKAILALTANGKDATLLYKVNSNTPQSAVEKLNNAEQSASAWSAPYTLAAYNRDGYSNREREITLVNALLASQGEENGAWDEWGTIDTTANAIAGLAFYLNDEDETIKAKVTTAIERALTYLSSQQNADGSFSDSWSGANSNSTAMVAIALAAAGVDVEEDERFIKDGKTVIDGLLAFALADGSGFGHTNNTVLSDSSTEQSFRALIALSGAIKSGEAYNVYDFNGITLAPARATGTSVGGATPSEPSGDNISVSVTIKADNGYWLRGYNVTLPGTGATVYHAFIKACGENGITYVASNDGYISSVTKDGKTLAEYGKGQNSGWLYKLNGSAPLLGTKECEIENGDSIQFLYTSDYTVEPGFGGWQAEEEKSDEPEEDAVQEAKPHFDDVGENHWAKSYIEKLAELGIINGRGNTFAPEDNITRAEFVAILSRIEAEENVAADTEFDDVSADAWYAENVAWAVENGITNGVSETSFAPNAKITREDMAVMLMRFIELKKITLASGEEIVFKDSDQIAQYATEAVSMMQRAGIISGMGDAIFAPKSFATRAQAAKMISLILEAYGK